MIAPEVFIQYGSVALLFIVPAITIAIGQGASGQAAAQAIEIQPQAAGEIRKNFLLGLALSETAAILTGIIVIFLIFAHCVPSPATACAYVGILFALGVPSACIGILSSFAQREALFSTARQPFFAAEILRLMLITLALMQTSVILGFIMALLIQNQIASVCTFTDSIPLLAAGIAFGCGTIGPLIGLGIYSGMACRTVGVNRVAYSQIMNFTLISQGLLEAPILFSLVIALLIVSGTQTNIISCLAAAIAISLSTLGPGIASGRIARAACAAIGAKNHDTYTSATISRTSLLAQTLVDTAPIYGMIVALSLLLF